MEIMVGEIVGRCACQSDMCLVMLTSWSSDQGQIFRDLVCYTVTIYSKGNM